MKVVKSSKHEHRAVWRYGVAIAAIVVAEALRKVVFDIPGLQALGSRNPTSFIYPAVMLAALYGGEGPGLVTAILGLTVAAVRFCYAGPTRHWLHEDDLARLTLLAMINGLILIICARIHRARRELALALSIREESERKITNTLEHITDAFFAVDRDMRFTYVNRQCEAFYGKKRQEMLGQGFFEVFPAHRGGPVEVGARKALSEQVPVHAAFYSPVTHRWVEGDVYPTPDGLSAYFRDVTDRHLAEEALKESQERYRRLVETAQEGICQIDTHGRVTYANPAMGRMLGVLAETIVGKLLVEFVEGELATPIERPAGGTALLQEIRLRRADSTSFIAQISTSPMRRDGNANGAGDYAGELAVITDVTERRTIETEREELLRREQRARADAEAANRRKDQFLAVLSHELRTPLTPVIARLALLRRDPQINAVTRNGLEMIRRNVELEAKLIDDLLDVTRLARGQLKLQFDTVDAHQTLRDALEIYEDDIARRRQQVDLDLAAQEHLVKADPVRLQQVFWNLISNAVKYTPEKGTITIRSTNAAHASNGDRTWLHILISDTGIGIDAEVMPRIFDSFEQGEQTLVRRYGGLGLGLSISRTLLHMHGGTLNAESAGAGKGAAFTIELPTVAAPTVAEAPHVKPAPVSAPMTQRILLVDDNEDTLRVMARLLRLGGHQVMTAESVTTALHAAAQPFDLLITDIGLPDGTGWDLMKQLQQRGPVCGIAVSGFSMDDDIHRSRELGFIEHLSKPVNPTDLDEAIAKAVAVGRC